ncbi:MAG: fatty acid desaturase [Myxococcota bacterium]
MGLVAIRANKTANINGEDIEVQAGETLLDAALRQGVDFPNSCRVGGCASCKCRVTSGQVRELTETAYLLSAEEIADGTVLACQSVPKTDVTIEVDNAVEGTRGVVVGQTKLTHDITRLEVLTEHAHGYRAGQFAQVTLDGLEHASRSYSFACPPRRDGHVEFFIRHVPGGTFSSAVQETDLVGRGVNLRPADGQFYLRDGEGPLLFVAGGSGLAPVLAILEEAAARGVERPVVLLFGAREQRDLYALDRIHRVADRWRGSFTFVPVLSQVPEGDGWDGARGMVTDLIPALADANTQAYLCGPPAMVDAGVERLSELGVGPRSIFFDRFTTRADATASAGAATVAKAETDRQAGFLDYAKFFGFHAVGLAVAASFIAGGLNIVAGLIGVIAAYVLGDLLLGDDAELPAYGRPAILTVQLWLALPLLLFISFVSVWTVCPTDVLGFGELVTRLTGYDVLAARAATSFGQHFAGFIATGLMIGMVGTIPAHELTHRTWDRISMFIGRGLLAFSFDTIFAIEHVYGHHRYVCTTEDPATAPRGRNVYWHILVSTLEGNISAWKIERDRLAKRGHHVLSTRNAFLRGHLVSVGLVGLAGLMGGWTAAGYFLVCALWGKATLEIVNYMEHYGLVRDPATPVQPRHSWNTNRRMSSWTMFNLTRHSHHHAQGEVPYHELQAYPDAPMMVSGYLSTMLLTLIPPLWYALMDRKLADWDRNFATDHERILARQADERAFSEPVHS